MKLECEPVEICVNITAPQMMAQENWIQPTLTKLLTGWVVQNYYGSQRQNEILTLISKYWHWWFWCSSLPSSKSVYYPRKWLIGQVRGHKYLVGTRWKRYMHFWRNLSPYWSKQSRPKRLQRIATLKKKNVKQNRIMRILNSLSKLSSRIIHLKMCHM